MAIQVVKANGKREQFSEDKVRQSLRRSGASEENIDKVLLNLTGQLRDGITTKEIYRMVYDQFNNLEPQVGVRYALRESLLGLGPSGYPFEKFIARLLTAMGYQTQLQVTVPGECITHEVDVVAEKEGKHFLIECKYHQRRGTKSRSKDALYVQARFDDIMAHHKKDPAHSTTFHQVWLVTNTKLTTQAIQYGRCKGMGLLAWSYPKGDSLEQLIEKHHFHPLTCLSFLDVHQRQLLLQNDVVLCRELKEADDKFLKKLGFNSATIEQIRRYFKNLI